MKSTTQYLAIASVCMTIGACSDLHPTASAIALSNIPAAIAVPTGNVYAFTLRGSGLQIYECEAKTGAEGGYGWTFVAPEAVLYDKSDSKVGRHYAGPTWEYGDDSKVTGRIVADSPAPRAGNISWLLLQGTPAARNGVLSGVTYVQRVNTDGGVVPSDPCSAATARARKGVRYSADYLFYKG